MVEFAAKVEGVCYVKKRATHLSARLAYHARYGITLRLFKNDKINSKMVIIAVITVMVMIVLVITITLLF